MNTINTEIDTLLNELSEVEEKELHSYWEFSKGGLVAQELLKNTQHMTASVSQRFADAAQRESSYAVGGYSISQLAPDEKALALMTQIPNSQI